MEGKENMKITVITGTEVKGCTYHIKEAFLEVLREGSSLTEFVLPRDLPHFCTGCKTCFVKGEELCPHAACVQPIWDAILAADLIVLASPVYALRAPGQMKALLPLCPLDGAPAGCSGKGSDLTNAIGPVQRQAQKDMATSLLWLGVSDVKKLGIALVEDAFWTKLSPQKRQAIHSKVQKLAARYKANTPARQGIKVKALFALNRLMHQNTARKENPLSADNQYWLERGWIKL